MRLGKEIEEKKGMKRGDKKEWRWKVGHSEKKLKRKWKEEWRGSEKE